MAQIGIGCRFSSDQELLWLWCRLAAAAPIQPLAWKLPYAMGTAIKRKKNARSLSITVMEGGAKTKIRLQQES